MPTAKKTATNTKSSAAKAANSPKSKTAVKKTPTSTGVAKKSSTNLIAKSVGPKTGASPKKVTAKNTVVKASVARTTNPRTSTVTIKKITRNIVGFYLTEDIETMRVKHSDNSTNEKLKAKYAELKTKINNR